VIEPLSDETLLERVALRARHPSSAAAARAAGMRVETLKYQLKIAASRGLAGFSPILEGFELKETTEQQNADGSVHRRSIKQVRAPGEVYKPLDGFQLKQRSTYIDADRRIVGQWNIEKAGADDPLKIAEWLKGAFKDVKPAKPIPAPRLASKDLLTLLPCSDWHLGMFAWGRETGENWDLKIAEDKIGRAVEDVVARSPRSTEAIVLGGGDLFHADNKDNQTARSGNALDVDGRYQKVVEAANRLMVRTIDANLRHHGKVTVRILPGNHDEHACVAVTYYLLAHYRKERRVTVDTDPSLFFYHPFGKVMLAATHGHQCKIAKLPGVMAHREPEMWGATKFRYAHGFHLHHSEKRQDECNGVLYEIHRSPVPPDGWHHGMGFLSGRSIQAITYHKDFGTFGRVETPIMDA
jgi:hypothetical protein